MNEEDFSDFFDNLKDPDIIEALVNPPVINGNIQDIQNTNGALIYPLLICDNPDIELQLIPKQLNFITPSVLKKSKEPYALNIKKDLNMYRKLYEKYAKNVNHIIEKTKESIKNLYKPLKKLRDEVKQYSNNFENSVKELAIPLENKKNGLNKIDYSKYPKDKQKKFLNDRNEVIKQINDFIKKANIFCDNYRNINKSTLQQIETFVQKFTNLAMPAKELRTFMLNFFRAFEKSTSSFKDLENKKKIDEALQRIKEPINGFCIKTENINEKLADVQNINLENLNDIVSETKKTINELQNKSKEISESIMKIREKYGEPKEELRDINIQNPKLVDVSSYSKSVDEKERALYEDTKEKLDALKNDVISIKNQSRMDLLFIMDVTNSMDIYLDEAKTGILGMIQKIKTECAGIEIYLGFIGYKDFSDLDLGEEYVNLELTDKYEEIQKNIEYIEADGGGDTPEDLCGAFYLGKEKNWTGKTRFIILVTDSPCHGAKYHDPKIEDNFSEGDREKRDIEEYVQFFAKNEISLFCLKINNTTDKMFDIFKKIYYENKIQNSNCSFVVEEGKKLFDIVTGNAIKMFQNRANLDITE